MYCAYCGSQNQEGAAFCGNCGKPVMAAVQQVPAPPVVKQAGISGIVSSSSKGFKWGSSGAALVVLCFFLPWFLVSCGGQSTRFSGWDLAAGTTFGSGYLSQPVEGQPELFLVLLAGLGVLALAYFAYRRGRIRKVTDGIGLIILSAFPLAMLYLHFEGVKTEAAQQGFYIDYQFGLWGTAIGLILVLTNPR